MKTLQLNLTRKSTILINCLRGIKHSEVFLSGGNVFAVKGTRYRGNPENPVFALAFAEQCYN